MKTTELSKSIRELASSVGIDALGFAEAAEFECYTLSRSVRRDPRLSLPDARSVIVAGVYIGGLVLPAWDGPTIGRTSRLFLSGFFNDVVHPLEPIADLLRREGHAALICDGSRDGGSILPLKLAAIRAGLGWQGKNSLLLSEEYGTFLALGGILTNASLEHNARVQANHCGDCQRCQQACPMQALEQAHVLNKGRCLSYLLQSDDLPEQAQAVAENRVMDCEICQQVCPWNARLIKRPLDTALTTAFMGEIPAWEGFFALSHLVGLSEKAYTEALGRLNTGIPYRIFHRNALIAMERLKRQQA